MVSLLIAASLMALGAEPSPAASSVTRPNVVLIIVDTLRADKLGCYGGPAGISPRIDQLASKGTLFEHVVAQCTWTRPSIGAMLTGRYPRTLGIYKEKGQILADRFTTLAEVLHANGYRTIGLTANPNINSYFNFQQGFDVYHDSNVIFPWMKKQAKQHYPSNTSLIPAITLFGEVLKLAMNKKPVSYYIQIDIMDVHEWALLINSPVRPEFREIYRNKSDSFYLQAVHQSDHDIGAFIAELSALPGWKNTLFIIVSDHGEGLSDHPSVRFSENHGTVLYRSNVAVPLILYHPGGAIPAMRVAQPVRLIDLFPTVLDYLHIPLTSPTDGTSLVPLMHKGNVTLPKYFITETQFRDFNKIAAYGTHWECIESHDNQHGCAPLELQPASKRQDGFLTSQLVSHRKQASTMDNYIHEWEKKHPKSAPVLQSTPLPSQEREELRSLGYVN